MSVPETRRPSDSPVVRKAPVFKTSSGTLVTAERGKPVTLDDVVRMVDMDLVIDTTGSMSDKIAGLVECLVAFVDELAKLKLDWRFTCVPFGDLTVPGDRIVGNLPFVTRREEAQSMIRNVPRFSGGGNSGESSLEAMQAAMTKPYRQGAIKVIVMLTDEPPLISHQLTPGTISDALRRHEFICFVASPPQQGYEEWAEKNGGVWYPIGASMDTAALLEFLKGLLRDVAKVSKAVFDVSGGSVSRFVLEDQRRKTLGR